MPHISTHDPHLTLAITKARQSELLKAAGRIRLMQETRASKHRLLISSALSGLGSFLISAGKRLQAQHTPVVPCCPDICQPDYSPGIG